MSLFLVCIAALSLSAQSKGSQQRNRKDPFLQQIAQINSSLASYALLSPFSEEDDRFEKIDSLREQITSQLLLVLNNKQILNYRPDTLFNSEGLMMSHSDDGRLYFFSIDEKTGGSYRTNVTLIHFRSHDGSAKADYYGGEASEALATSSYSEVYSLDSLGKNYIALGGVNTCNTCLAQVAVQITVDSLSYESKMVAMFDGRRWDLNEFLYDYEAQVFWYEYQDPEEGDSLYGSEDYVSGWRQKYRYKFKFVGDSFLQVESCEWREKEVTKNQ